MVKSIILFSITLCALWSSEKTALSTAEKNPVLERECFECHRAQKIPSEATYRRYLLKYSSKETIREKMFIYLKSPSKERSIMPLQFFSKYPIKEASQLKEEVLHKRIDEYTDYFDISKRLFIPADSN